MTQRLIDAYRTVPKLVSQLHLPVQSGSDRVLAAMKRGYTALEYKSIVRRLREARPALSLSSDFIVGFPGETERDFEQTMRLIDEVGFDGSFSFLYSPRPGTPAADFADAVPREIERRGSRGCSSASTRNTRFAALRWWEPSSARWSPAAPAGMQRSSRRGPRTIVSSISPAAPI